VQPEIPDLQFTSRYRVPFQFSRVVRQNFSAGSFLQSSSGPVTTDLDGNRFHDLTGSYGVNVFGYDFYKECIERGSARVRDLGPVLGAYHPITADNVHRLREISGQEEISFHMSGTEAVMQAVRLARYHTRRSHLVRFCGAYHGWWGDVQPGVGNPLPARDTYTLKEMAMRRCGCCACAATLPVCWSIRCRRCIRTPARPQTTCCSTAPALAHFDRAAYGEWLKALRAVCTERNIVLIFDEVFVGFRLARGGAQEYFGVKADMVTYGKTVGGGPADWRRVWPQDLMRRFREDRPADICFARGTFNSHPVRDGSDVRIPDAPGQRADQGALCNLDEVWDARAEHLNERLRAAGLNVQVANLSSIWTVCYPRLRATTGCCNTICAPMVWLELGWHRAV
jgi:glutamate-1-semialdehyde 2,1-aminomutase